MSDNSSVARAILDVIGQQHGDDEPVSVVFIDLGDWTDDDDDQDQDGQR